MLQARRRFGLATEALDELPVLGEAAVQNLQRHLTLKVGVFGEPDVGHPSRADPAQDPVAGVDDASLAHLSHRAPPPLSSFAIQDRFRDVGGRSARRRRCRT